MSDQSSVAEGAQELLELYDLALPRVYGYLYSRCGTVSTAEELTSETFLAAADAVVRGKCPAMSTAWLIGVARHKLVDHWRRKGREERGLQAVGPDAPESNDPWEIELDVLSARATLDRLAPHYRAALVLRYLDDLPVSEVASILERTVHATEGLLVRARSAFRQAYVSGGEGDA